jgi:hypothetical protein
MNILLYHHLGLGDHIICSGIVREIYDKYDVLHLCCKQHNVATVQDLYCDLTNLHLIIGDDDYANTYIDKHKNLYDEVLRIGFNLNTQESFEKQFYKMASLDFSKKWSNFYIPYDFGLVGVRANRLFKQQCLPQDYILVHDDERFKINKIKKGKHIFRISDISTPSMLDYLDIIRNAKELHVIDSAFMFLIDCWNYDYSHQNLYIHRYARHNEDWLLPTLRKDWIVLT